MKLGEAVYKSQQKNQPKSGDENNKKTPEKEKDNVVDADFEDVKEDKKKKAPKIKIGDALWQKEIITTS